MYMTVSIKLYLQKWVTGQVWVEGQRMPTSIPFAVLFCFVFPKLLYNRHYSSDIRRDITFHKRSMDPGKLIAKHHRAVSPLGVKSKTSSLEAPV